MIQRAVEKFTKKLLGESELETVVSLLRLSYSSHATVRTSG